MDSGKKPLNILQINVEGWTTAKREVLQQLVAEKSCTAVLVQETHQTNSDKLKLYGYTLADFVPSAHHGIATFIRNTVPFVHVARSDEDDLTQWIATEIDNIQVVNLYHPPPLILDISHLPTPSPQFIIAGDFNCRHESWGYPDSNVNGESLAAWCALNNLHVLFDPKQSASFHSGRWNRGTNPDILYKV